MELIKVTKENGSNVVSAKGLHGFLEIQSRWDIWAKRMFEYGFTENVDYQRLNKNVQMPTGGSKTALDDYALSLNCAKEISMVQNSDKGKQARQYFIECERKLKEVTPTFTIPSSLSEALYLAAKQAEQIETQQKELIEKTNTITEQKPKVEFFDAVAESGDAVDIGTCAKVLKLGVGRNKLFEFLRDNNVLMHNNQPYQSMIDRGYFRIVEQKYVRNDGSTHINIKTLVYQRGLDYILKLYNKSK